MSAGELDALAALRFDWTSAQEGVWSPSPYHVEGLHDEVAMLIGRGIDEARQGTSPLGIMLQGERGVGKTHLLGWTRQRVQAMGGYFFLVGISSGRTFWEEVLGAILERLQPHPAEGQDQIGALLGDLSRRAGLGDPARKALAGAEPLTPEHVGGFAAAVRRMDPSLTLPCLDTLRALVLLASPQEDQYDIGYLFLSGEELDTGERHAWGIRSTRLKKPQAMIANLSRILALSGPTVIAIDQVDAMIDEINRGPGADDDDPDLLVNQVATGMMDLRDLTRRTLTIVACLPRSWEFIKERAVDTVSDRFRHVRQLRNLPGPGVGRAMVEKRFAPHYAAIGFVPRYPTWPILPSAFEEAPRYTARRLLQRIEAHVASCLRERTVRELDRLDEWNDGGPPPEAEPTPADLSALDARFGELRAAADVNAALDAKTEDVRMPALLGAGLEAWIRERGDQDRSFLLGVDSSTGRYPALHGQLLQTIDEDTERRRQWAFRAIASDNAKAVLGRLRAAQSHVGLDRNNAERRLYVLRNSRWPTGPTSERETAAFTERGGVAVPLSGDDLRTFDALQSLLAESPRGLDGWLRERRPAHGTELFARALGDAAPVRPVDPVDPPPARQEPESDSTIRIGTTADNGTPVNLGLSSLRRHVAIFAGSGSGKTVLLRRLIEECALRGVSVIVLDPNNDLARLGDAWPQVPDAWLDGDRDRARTYLAETDVTVWTPRRQGGRPLTFQPLPSFADVRDDVDEFDAAVDAAVEALAPRVNANRRVERAGRDRAVLTEALRYFARDGGGNLDAFISLLAALPEDASTLGGATATAAELAEKLKTARVTDPLFGGNGQAADPGMLLTPPPGKRARVSVISLIGLPGEEQRQSFVNQLQMALFSWIKKHPAGDRPLGGLLVMDEAQTLAPAGRSTPCTHSTLLLASQARKYGLGLVFATQSPRGLHNQISGNATTQFFGLLSHPTQVNAAKELARAKGGSVPDIARLSKGRFYLGVEGRAFQKIQTPMCLSHHPPSPLTEEEVIGRARPEPPQEPPRPV